MLPAVALLEAPDAVEGRYLALQVHARTLHRAELPESSRLRRGRGPRVAGGRGWGAHASCATLLLDSF